MPHFGEWDWIHIRNILNSNGREYAPIPANIQRALDDVGAGGTVWLPGNTTFAMNSEIYLNADHQELVGRGWSTQITNAAGYIGYLVHADKQNRLAHLNINCDGDVNYAVFWEPSYRGVIEDVYFDGPGAQLHLAGDESYVKNCSFVTGITREAIRLTAIWAHIHNCYGAGGRYFINTAAASKEILVTNGWVENCAQDCIRIAHAVERVKIRNFLFQQNVAGTGNGRDIIIEAAALDVDLEYMSWNAYYESLKVTGNPDRLVVNPKIFNAGNQGAQSGILLENQTNGAVIGKGYIKGCPRFGVESTGTSDFVLLDALDLRNNTMGAQSLAGANNVIGDLLT